MQCININISGPNRRVDRDVRVDIWLSCAHLNSAVQIVIRISCGMFSTDIYSSTTFRTLLHGSVMLRDFFPSFLNDFDPPDPKFRGRVVAVPH